MNLAVLSSFLRMGPCCRSPTAAGGGVRCHLRTANPNQARHLATRRRLSPRDAGGGGSNWGDDGPGHPHGRKEGVGAGTCLAHPCTMGSAVKPGSSSMSWRLLNSHIFTIYALLIPIYYSWCFAELYYSVASQALL